GGSLRAAGAGHGGGEPLAVRPEHVRRSGVARPLLPDVLARALPDEEDGERDGSQEVPPEREEGDRRAQAIAPAHAGSSQRATSVCTAPSGRSSLRKSAKPRTGHTGNAAASTAARNRSTASR